MEPASNSTSTNTQDQPKIRQECPACMKEFKFSLDKKGRRAQCKQCGTVFLIGSVLKSQVPKHAVMGNAPIKAETSALAPPRLDAKTASTINLSNLPAMAYCALCGSQIPENLQLCSSCDAGKKTTYYSLQAGGHLGQNARAASGLTMPMKIVVAGGLLFALIVFGTGIFVIFRENRPYPYKQAHTQAKGLTSASIVSIRLEPFVSRANGAPLKKAVFVFKNTGETPVRAIFADLKGYDDYGNQVCDYPHTCVYATFGDGISAGKIGEKPDEGGTLLPVAVTRVEARISRVDEESGI